MPPGDRRRRARSGPARGAPRPAHQGGRGADRGRAAGHLARRAPVRAGQALERFDPLTRRTGTCGARTAEAIDGPGPEDGGPDGGAADAASGGPAPEARRPASRGMAAGERATAQAPRGMMGAGLAAIPAIGVGTALTIAAEAGPGMPAFPSARHPAPGWGWRREPGPSAAGPCRAARQRWPAGWRRPRPWPPCPPAGARPSSAPGAAPASPGRTRRWRSPRPPANPRASPARWSRGGRDTWSGAWRNTGGGA